MRCRRLISVDSRSSEDLERVLSLLTMRTGRWPYGGHKGHSKYPVDSHAPDVRCMTQLHGESFAPVSERVP